MRYLIIIALVLAGCSPKVNTSLVKLNLPDRSHLSYEPFAVIEDNNTSKIQGAKEIGQVKIKDSGFTLFCDYETVKKLVKQEALKLGGNCYVITEHKEPDNWSTCHRITATVYDIANPKDFEKRIEWSPKRKLVIEDFKGPTEKRPFVAATASSFSYIIQAKKAFSKDYKLEAVTFFDCHSSYFKKSNHDEWTLRHEQVHFDISELYARKFVKEMYESSTTVKEALAIHQEIAERIGRELQLKQDEYDSEVYADRSQQEKWNDWIATELDRTKAYAKKRFTSRHK